LNDDAADVLTKLYLAQEKNGDTSGCEDTRALITKLGLSAKLDAAAGKSGKPVDRTVVTEDNLWTKKHSEGERIDIESTPRFAPPNQPTTAPASPQPAGAVSGGPSERDQWLLRLARGVGGGPPKTKAPAPAAAPAASAPVVEKAKPAETPAPPSPPSFAATEAEDIVDDRLSEDTVATAVEPEEPEVEEDIEAAVEDQEPEAEATSTPADEGLDLDDDLPPIPETPPPSAARAAAPSKAPAAAKEPGVHISALIDEDDSAVGGEEDYRSHYDLGMAYIEMDLLSEAIREYQIASKSPQFQVKCLEMIGVCFLKQNQPQLAIRQLNKGLSLIGNESEESIGIKYNLGLAYEMIGDLDNARTHFEDVYVVDVTFREVADKISKLSGS
ncbi:MAG TPA: tetratricopeptide repeat protein, partial [Candidatus Krumholzibacteria bacterium]|nr:tetratricopeptide repeat protein [Candidatus Krumholzibacteria bacterium]